MSIFSDKLAFVPYVIGLPYGEANLHLYEENNYYSPSTIITNQYPKPLSKQTVQ